jgi:hypothetical protein
MADQNKQAKRKFYEKKKGANYDQNDGVAGGVYILGNKALKFNYQKIGCTRYSGRKRASDLNKDANTGTPAHFFCAFEQKTVDCGLAEKRVHQRLASYRRGKKGQEYFELPYKDAKTAVIEECQKVDSEYAERKKLPKIIGTRSMLGRYSILKESEN